MAASLLGGLYLWQDRHFENRSVLPFWQLKAECWVSDARQKYMQTIPTNVYVWGEGQQVDAKQDYSNFTPKNLAPFRGKDKPNIIDLAFGWYHEAFIDSEGRLWVCKK